jgi:hypothetical protein
MGVARLAQPLRRARWRSFRASRRDSAKRAADGAPHVVGLRRDEPKSSACRWSA